VAYDDDMNTFTMLDKVQDRLKPLKGEALHRVAAATGMSYDSVLRIRDGRVDPPFSKVQQLAALFRVVRK